MREGTCVLCGDDFKEFEGHIVESGPIHMTERYCIDSIAKSRDAAWEALHAVAQFFAERNWCPICEKTLSLKHPEKYWRAGHKRKCPLALYDMFTGMPKKEQQP